jgi:hypothetical protein
MSPNSKDLIFTAGDAVVLANGTYQGTSGTFLRLREDPKWADIAQQDGTTRSHPLAWLTHATPAATTPDK